MARMKTKKKGSRKATTPKKTRRVYKKPIGKRLRQLNAYKQWRDDVLSRANYRCQLCGTQHNLQAHHLIYMAKIIKMYNIKTIEQAKQCQILWEVKNGIAVCSKCHDIIHGNGFGFNF